MQISTWGHSRLFAWEGDQGGGYLWVVRSVFRAVGGFGVGWREMWTGAPFPL